MLGTQLQQSSGDFTIERSKIFTLQATYEVENLVKISESRNVGNEVVVGGGDLYRCEETLNKTQGNLKMTYSGMLWLTTQSLLANVI